MMRIFQYFYISTQLTPVSTLRNSLVHPKDTQRKRCQSDVLYEFCATKTLFVKMHILMNHLNHYSIVLDNAVDIATTDNNRIK